jgi:hypothetical protein
MQSDCPHSRVSIYSHVLWLISQLFHAHPTDYLLLVGKECSSVYFTFHLSFHAMAVKLSLAIIFSTLPQFHFLLSTSLRHHYSIWYNSPTQCIVSVGRSSDIKGDKLSMYSLCPAFSGLATSPVAVTESSVFPILSSIQSIFT